MNTAIILAGGTGQRMADSVGVPKQFFQLNGKPVLIHTLEIFDRHPGVDAICLVCLPEWETFVRDQLVKWRIEKVRNIISGGASRRESIKNGLESLVGKCSPDAIIVVHDGVRPFVTPELISNVIAATRKHNSVTTVYHNYEALLVSSSGLKSSSIVPRSNIYDIQTPQGFRFKSGLENYRLAEAKQIDESISGGDMFITLGQTVYMVEGSKANMKLTTGGDMDLLLALDALNQKKHEQKINSKPSWITHNNTGTIKQPEIHPVIMDDVEKLVDIPAIRKIRDGKVLITGISGMIGSYFALALHQANLRHNLNLTLFGLSRNSSVFAENFPGVDIKLMDHDVLDPLTNEERFDYILHAASPIGSRMFSQRPLDALSANVTGTLNLLEKARRDGTRRYLFTSSLEVYGDANASLLETDGGLVDVTDPRSCYPVGKRAAENACVCVYRQYGIETVIARLSRLYGPGMNLDCGLFISDFIRDCRQGTDITVTGDGLPLRPLCYVADAVRGLFHLLAYGKPGEAYNVAPREAYTIKEIAGKVAQIRENGKIVYSSPEVGVAYSKMGQNATQDIQKISALGWEPLILLDDGLRRTMKYFNIPTEK